MHPGLNAALGPLITPRNRKVPFTGAFPGVHQHPDPVSLHTWVDYYNNTSQLQCHWVVQKTKSNNNNRANSQPRLPQDQPHESQGTRSGLDIVKARALAPLLRRVKRRKLLGSVGEERGKHNGNDNDIVIVILTTTR